MANYVDKDQVLDILRSAPLRVTNIHIGKAIIGQYGEGCRGALVDAVEKMEPAMDVEPVRHGFWIDRGKTEAGTPILECSYCDRVRKGGGKSAYCRDCGAKMDQECGFLI